MRGISLFTLLLAFGLTLGQQQSATFNYEAQIRTGIPSIQGQAAVTGMKAEVKVAFERAGLAKVQLKDVRVGNYHGFVGNNLRNHVQIPYQQEVSLLETPFEVNTMAKDGEEVMKVDEKSPLWVTNILKSIANVIKVRDLVHLILNQHDVTSNTVKSANRAGLTRWEDTMLGNCEVDYTVTPRTRGSDELIVRRSINVRKCHDEVLIQQAGIGNATQIHRDQFEFVSSRSSVGQYVVKRSGNAMQLESAIVEGYTMSRPFKFGENHIEVITNQTLTDMRPGTVAIKLPSSVRSIKTWKMQVESPNGPPAEQQYNKNWVNYQNQVNPDTPLILPHLLTGLPVNASLFGQMKQNVIELLKEASQMIREVPKVNEREEGRTGSSTGEALRSVHWMSRNLMNLPTQIIEQIFSEVFKLSGEDGELQKNLLIDGAANAATAPCIKVLMRYVKSKQITLSRALTILATFSSTMKAPATLVDILDVLKDVNLDENPIIGGNMLINMGHLVSSSCIQRPHFDYTLPLPIIGNQNCPESEVVQPFVQLLLSKLLPSDKPIMQIMGVWALVKVGSREANKHLIPIILKEKNYDRFVRVVAVNALSQWNQQGQNKAQSIETLLRVIEELGEDTLVRQNAIQALVTWDLESDIWQRLARLTWVDRSVHVSAFLASTIHSFSQITDPHHRRNAQAAQHAKFLMKPTAEFLNLSYHNHTDQFYMPWRISTFNDQMKMFTSDNVPRQLQKTLKVAFDQFRFPLISSTAFLNELPDSVKEKLMDIKTTTLEALEIVMDEMAKTLQGNGGGLKMFQNTVLLQNMNLFLPFDNDFMKSVLNSESISKLREGQSVKLHATKFFNPVSVHSVMATTVGLPVMVANDGPMLFVIEGTAAYSHESLSNDVSSSIELDLNFRVSNKVNTRLDVLVPWTEQIIAAGLDTEKTIALPAKYKIHYEYETGANKYRKVDVALTISPRPMNEFPLWYAHNIPTTTFEGMWLTEQPSQVESKIIHHSLSKFPLYNYDFPLNPAYTGLKMRVKWRGDAEMPLNTGDFTDCMRHPQKFMALLGSPVGRYWRAELMMDTKQNPVRSMRFQLTGVLRNLVPGAKSATPVKVPGFPEYQNSQITLDGKENQAILAGNFATYEGTSVQSGIFYAFTLYGQDSRITPRAHDLKYGLNVVRSRIPGVSEKQDAVCSIIETQGPHYNTMKTLTEALRGSMVNHINGQLTYGQKCDSEKVDLAKMQGIIDVTSERKTQLIEELDRRTQAELVDPTRHLPINAVYDQFQATVTYKKEDWPLPLLNASYALDDWYRGHLFPHIWYDYMTKNTEGQTKIHASRPIPPVSWDLVANLPTLNTRIDYIKKDWLPWTWNSLARFWPYTYESHH